MKKILGRNILKLIGWKLDISVPVHNVPKCVLVAAPHTTNWDFFYTIISFWAMEIPMKFFIKDSWTKPWYGFIIESLGGIGIDRSQRANRVDYAAELLKNSNRLYMLNTPEGSRSRAEKWKTGFYYMAQKAEVPILLAYCDYEKKIAGIGKVIHLENKSKEEVLTEIQDFYLNIKGKHPENYNPKIF
ncbi:1-acyl-sn-glycerol-3-phosphate acyltransferase [Moheibacter sp.]|uniref:1-acyl-sn-glycerol-3-phosphate acyltransferase n=1 Tax=Moheibacter sp. TaxID=1965316 RepID=UPI003C77FAC5